MIPRIVIAGTKSGVGKTTLTAGIIAAVKNLEYTVQGFKVGPDYIDPSYHALASGRPSSNLDVWLMGETGVRKVFSRRTQDADIAVIEGVMGLFDGNFRDGSGSTAHIAKLLKAPVVLVLDCRSMGQSAAAHVLGFKLYDTELEIAGVILNQVGSLRHGEVLKQVIEEKCHLPVVGMLMRDDELVLPSRHLGLIPTAERQQDMQKLAHKISQAIDINKLIALAQAAPKLEQAAEDKSKLPQAIRWAVAEDEAFSFAYPDSLQELQELGIQLVPFSPLRDKYLPDHCKGIIIGGGFPEVYAQALAENKEMLRAVKAAAELGTPIYAECGGLMYLTQRIISNDGQSYPMAGVVHGETIMRSRLVAMGYVEASALRDNLLCKRGEEVQGHVFHYSEMLPLIEDFPWAWNMKFMRGGKVIKDGYAKDNVLASYIHLHFTGLKNFIRKFIEI